MAVRPRWLTAAGSADAGETDGRAALAALADGLVPAHADACFVDVSGRDGAGLRRTAAAIAPALDAGARAAFGRDLLGPLETIGAAAAATLAAGETRRLDGAAVADQLGGSNDERRMLAHLTPRAALLVPLRARGHVLGVITLLRTTAAGGFGEEEVRDVEELALQAALLLENARLERRAQTAQRARSEFLAIVSHELRTPLNIILGYAELLLSGIPDPLQPRSQHQVERMRTSARYLLQRIEEVLAYARLEGRRERVHLQPVALGPLLRETIDLVEPLAAAKSLQITAAIGGDVQLVTDATHLRQILLHLLTNAIRFTERGAVKLESRTEDTGVAIEVADTGRGMTDEQVAQVFEPFWQADALETRTAHGTGLGLSLARRLAELLGGRITCRSQPGRGTTFTLHLPLRPSERELRHESGDHPRDQSPG